MAESKKTAKNSDAGVFDVSKPGKSAPPSSAKPIIVTNRPVLKDPMVNEDASDETVAGENLPDTPKASLVAGRVKIEPLHQVEAPKEAEDKTATDSVTTSPDSKSEVDDAKEPDTDEKEDETGSSDSDKSKSKKTTPEDDEVLVRQEAERQEQLNQLAESHKYYLPINQVEKRRAKHMVILGAVFIVILGLAWADVALDAGLVNIPGVKAPTHFFK